MAIEVMQGSYGRYWVPLDYNANTGDTFYIGSLVKASSDGVAPVGSMSGAFDISTIAGVIVGFNLKEPVFDSTYKTEKSLTTTSAHDDSTGYVLLGGSGKMVVGDTSRYALIDAVGPGTVLKAPIYTNSFGTAITVGTVTTGNTDGTGFTCSGGLMDFAGTVVADTATVYCRSGNNKGLYRHTTDTSATVKTVDHDFPRDIVAGDTFVAVELKMFGECKAYLDAEGLYLDVDTDNGTNYISIFVLALDLREAGKEHCIFRLTY
uniref:Uncharacterized protein n=1 Tax=viral metagenome TaxID=1070528 RepID=A0A6H1Z881_9ZZZZ